VALQVLLLRPTPPQSQHKKAKSTLGSTFKQAEEDDLLAVVLVQNNPYKKLTVNQANRIWKELLKHLEAITDQHDTVIPHFYEGGLKHGRYHLSCYDAHGWSAA